MNQWISVKERLPENNETVLVFDNVDGYEIVKAKFKELEWFDRNEELYLDSKDITHWMPYCGDPKEPMTFKEMIENIKNITVSFMRGSDYREGASDCAKKTVVKIEKYAKENGIEI